MQIRTDANSSTNALTDSAAMDSAVSEGAIHKKKARQSRAVINFWIDLLAFLTFLISTISGLALMHSPGGHGPPMSLPDADSLWGLSRFEWQHLHTQISIICVVLIAVHLIMHRRWIASRLGRVILGHGQCQNKIDEIGSTGDDTTMSETSRVCPWQRAWLLDNWIRRLIHNPDKILGSYIGKGQTVLDLGSGPGMFSLAMARMVGEGGKVISVDIQEEMLWILRRKSEQAGLESRILLHKSQPDGIGLSDKVDFALAFYMIHEVPDKEGFLREVAALLKAKGKLLMVEPRQHVSETSFEETVELAHSAGLRLISRPKVLFSRAALLQKR